jgi:hypothetical protein
MTNAVEQIRTRALAGQKFDASEVTPVLREVALKWLAAYTGDFDFLLDLREKSARYDLSDGQVKGVLNCLLAQVRRDATAPAPSTRITEAGFYRAQDGRIVKVQESQAGRLYAKVLTQVGDDEWAFEYVQGAMRFVTPADKLSLEDAQAFGRLYGWCCCCGRRLTNEESIELGIGPICRTKWF